LKVTFVSNEFFIWDRYGGFGAFTRKLAVELVRNGVEVEVLMEYYSHLQQPQPWESTIIDGVVVRSLRRLRNSLLSSNVYKIDADVIHSECDPGNTHFVFRSNPATPKVVTIQDLRSVQERKKLTMDSPSMEWGMPSLRQIPGSVLVWHFARKNLKEANVVAVQARLLKPKVQSVLHYYKPVLYLPNFVDVPTSAVFKKSVEPTVLFLGRLDPVKNPELMFEVAKRVPNVNFYVLGKTIYKIRDMKLHKMAEQIPNLHLLGHDSDNLKEELLCKAWILLNTSYYECLPMSFLEALAHKCALLSTQNPDGYTSRFGVHCEDSAERLSCGLLWLIEKERWRELGRLGYEYVKANHETQKCVGDHINLYNRLRK
jgi:glycosyltransferase involved in cell wall biosynthesis